jgi:hypothetical protein
MVKAKDEPSEAFTLDEIRLILSEEIRKIQDGSTTAANVNAISNATGKILSSVKLQMEYYRLTGKPLPPIPMLTGPTGPEV